jgi:hypothetical protein
MNDKEKIVLGVSGTLAASVLGYLIWRHEESVSVANQQAATAQQAQIAAQQDAELQQELESLPQYASASTGGESASTESAPEDNLETPPDDSALEQILQAFYPSTANSTSSTSGTTGTLPIQGTTTSSVKNVPAPVIPRDGQTLPAFAHASGTNN